MDASLYWHDYETWGASPAFDRPSQFAGIRTNLALEPIAEPDIWYCQPTPDVLPDPYALIVTGITPQEACAKGLPEPLFMRAIAARLGVPATCSLGYNSLRFDDEVTRYGLYRQLMDPYAREWQGGNSRWDIIDMVRTCYALRPDCLNWPYDEAGKPSFKLERLAEANGLTHRQAHNALSDVEATLGLARLIKSREPALYDHLWQLRTKAAVAAFFNPRGRQPFLHVSSKISAQQGCAGLFIPLCPHPRLQNALLAFNLEADPTPLWQDSAEQLAERIFTPQTERSDGQSRLPVKAIHFNRCPVVLTPKLLTNVLATRLGIDKDRCEQHWHQLMAWDRAETLQQAFALRVFDAAADPEQQLYDALPPAADKTSLRRWQDNLNQGMTPDALAACAELPFHDTRYRGLRLRFFGRFAPEYLTAQEREAWQHLCTERWFNGMAGYRTWAEFTAEVNLLCDAHPHKAQALQDLTHWYSQALSTFKK